MIDIYNVKVQFDSQYNAGVKHSLNVYTLKNYVWWDIYVKFKQILALCPCFHLKLSTFSFCLLGLHFCDLVMLNL